MKYLAFVPFVALLAGCAPSGDSNNSAAAGGDLKTNYTAENAAPAPSDPSLQEPKFEAPKDGEEVAVMTTKFGKIVFKFRPDLAPKHVENFKKLAGKGFYDHTIFHRVIPGFMIQGGDPNTKDKSKVAAYGSGGPGYSVKAEFNNLDHKRGVVSMARSGDPNSAGSQFYVVVADSPHLNREYTAFGEVVSGMDAADKIVAQPRDGNDMPAERIEMTVKIEKWPVK